MSEPNPSKQDLLDAIETERTFWNAVVDAANAVDGGSNEALIDEVWSFSGLGSHLNGWRSWTLARLEAAADGKSTAQPPWPDGMVEDTSGDVDEVNAWFLEQCAGASVANVSAEANEQFDQLAAAVERIPNDDLLNAGRFSLIDADLPIGPALLGFSFTHMHVDHEPGLRRWLDARSGGAVALPPAPSNFGYED